MPTLDASTPARALTTQVGSVETGICAAFSPPADSWIFVTMAGDPNGGGQTPSFGTPTGGTGLSWTQIASVNNASGGCFVVWRAYNASLQTGIQIQTQITWSGAVVAGSGYWVDVWTGCALSQAGAATPFTTTNTGPSTQNFGVTTTAPGSRVVGAGLDWNVTTPAPTSSDTIDAYTFASHTTGGRVIKGADTPAAGTPVTVNLVWGAGSPIGTYVAYEILGAASNDGTYQLTSDLYF